MKNLTAPIVINVYNNLGLFNVNKFKFNSGINFVIGINGAGKTTLLEEINQVLKGNETLSSYLYKNEVKERSALEEALFYGKNDIAIRNITSSEGQNIAFNFGDELARIRQFFEKCVKEKRTPVLLLDGLDSGLSINLIIFLRDCAMKFLQEKCNELGLGLYLIITANSFEFCRGNRCVDVVSGEEIVFNDYEEFKNFYINQEKESYKNEG